VSQPSAREGARLKPGQHWGCRNILKENAARHANDADIERFATTEEGAQLVKEWGRDVGRRLPIVCARLDRMLLNGGDMNAAVEWFEDLTSAEAKSILTALAHGR